MSQDEIAALDKDTLQPSRAAVRGLPKARDKADTVMQTRISKRHRDLIDDAAALRGVSRSTFVIETLLEKSEKILLETLLFQLDAQQSLALADLLDNPPPPTAALRELMASKAPWES